MIYVIFAGKQVQGSQEPRSVTIILGLNWTLTLTSTSTSLANLHSYYQAELVCLEAAAVIEFLNKVVRSQMQSGNKWIIALNLPQRTSMQSPSFVQLYPSPTRTPKVMDTIARW